MNGFYPDFILWMKHGGEQRIVFVEPHGMVYARPYAQDDKARLHERLPSLAQSMATPEGVSSVSLDSYIVSATPFDELRRNYDDGSWTRERFKEKHILFRDGGSGRGCDYLAALFDG